ncbi:uncharacterized protein [Coffea arabica]|uniref:Uncharacterized protein n=1 Tax=Coffea arabica TaxID=13443 RepID=A0ABM4V3K6_COFAR
MGDVASSEPLATDVDPKGGPQSSGGLATTDGMGGEELVCVGDHEGGCEVERGCDSPPPLLPVAEGPGVVRSSALEWEGDGELPHGAGNLSPTIGSMPGRPEGTLLLALNVDQAVEVEEGLARVKSADLWVFCKSLFACTLVGSSDQHITLDVHHPLLPRSLVLSWVHAGCSVEARKDLWRALLGDKPRVRPWCIRGNFNVILEPFKKCGGQPFVTAEGVDLMSFMEEAEVFDAGFLGPSFTWCSNRRGFTVGRDPRCIGAAREWLSLAGIVCQALGHEEGYPAVNKCSFGDIFEAVKGAESQMAHAELKAESDDSEGAHIELQRAQAEYRHALAIEEQFWSFELLQIIPPLILQEDNQALEDIPSMEEVKQAVYAMDGDSAVGPDGFTGKFFTFAWDIIAKDVYNAVVSFFCGAELPRFIISTSIVLIPKIPNPQDFSKFRPISLCNFINKVLSHLLSDRVAALLPKIISLQ